jgi:cell division protein FtsI (penicillin-binding protein 3)
MKWKIKSASSIVQQSSGSWRRWAAAAALGLFGIAVVGRAFDLQVVQREFLTREGDRRHVRTVELPGFRGAIRDRRGEPLALSAPVDSIWVLPSELLNAPPYLNVLARLLGYKTAELKQYLSDRDDRQFVYLRRQIDPDEASRILSVKAPGVFAQREYRRYYPAGEVASHVVGFCNIDGKGQEGIESVQDAILRGKPGARRVIRDNSGRIIEDTDDYKEAQPGQDVTLTLDLHLQYVAYRELKAAVEKNNAKGGMIVVADPATGEILALASQPGYNPNRPDDRDSEGLRDTAVTDAFEPGSTIKPLLIAQAFEQGKWTPDSHVDTGPGTFKVGTLTVHDIHPNGYIDLAHLLSKSSNVGAAKVGLSLGPQAVWSGYQKFGIGEPVGAGLPGEAASVLRPYSEWGEIATATASYGYGISVSALHMVRAYSALAEDGLMPSLSVVRSATHIPPQRVISAQAARDVRRLLEGVVAPDGTALRAAVPGYRVAGKTGTVRKAAGGGYAQHEYLSVFIGMAPADHPRLVALVMIDDPRGTDYYGGLVAAPVFSNVMRAGLRLLQVPPDMPVPASPTQTAALPPKAHT